MTEENNIAVQPYRILLAKPEDESFLFDSWLNSYRHSDYGKHVGQKTFYYRERQRLERVLNDSRTMVFTARANDNDDQIFGYAVATFDDYKKVTTLHYIYVKQAFRRLGVGAALLNAVVMAYPEMRHYFCSYLTKQFFCWSLSKKFEYSPYYFDRIDL